MAKLVRTLGENVPPELVFPAATPPRTRRRASTLSVPESVLERRRGGDFTTSTPAVEDVPFSYPSTVPYVPEGRSSSDSFVSASTHISTVSDGSSHDGLMAPHPRVGAHNNTHRKEQGWSGEWGGDVANMDDVVRNLRSLKLR
jgi:hypothetical protein